MQTSILEQYPSAELRVYTVWVQMLWEDSRSAWDSRMMPDARVTQFWDEQQIVAQWFAQQVNGHEETAWDIYYLYGPEATWETVPSSLIGTGRTIISKRETLEAQILPLLQP